MSPEEHKQRHVGLHRALDELLADWIGETDSLPSQETVMDFLKWSHAQTENPSDKRGLYSADTITRDLQRLGFTPGEPKTP